MILPKYKWLKLHGYEKGIPLSKAVLNDPLIDWQIYKKEYYCKVAPYVDTRITNKPKHRAINWL